MSSGVIPTATAHVSIPDTDLEVSVPLHELVVKEILPDLGMEAHSFWALLEEVITEMAPKNNILLLKRYQIQAEINTWHQARSDAPHDPAQYKKFLQRIGYLLPEGPDFTVGTTNVDEEIAIDRRCPRDFRQARPLPAARLRQAGRPSRRRQAALKAQPVVAA